MTLCWISFAVLIKNNLSETGIHLLCMHMQLSCIAGSSESTQRVLKRHEAGKNSKWCICTEFKMPVLDQRSDYEGVKGKIWHFLNWWKWKGWKYATSLPSASLLLSSGSISWSVYAKTAFSCCWKWWLPHSPYSYPLPSATFPDCWSSWKLIFSLCQWEASGRNMQPEVGGEWDNPFQQQHGLS